MKLTLEQVLPVYALELAVIRAAMMLALLNGQRISQEQYKCLMDAEDVLRNAQERPAPEKEMDR